MMTKPPMAMTDVDSLLAQARWVEGFARALVREDSDDVAQDAWLAAIQHPPATTGSPRPWFATVMRNLKRMRFRGAARRRAREEASAPEDHVPTPGELAHRMELQRRLATAVIALDEPQRSTVVLVFYEGLSPAEVARQQGVPATTVRSRVRAALATLRDRLDAEDGGDRGRWKLALAPIAAPKLVPATAPVWVFAVAAIVLVAMTGVIGAIRYTASHADVEREVGTRSIHTGAPATATSSAASRPDPRVSRTASIPTLTVTGDEGSHDPAVPPGFARAERTLMDHVDQCYEIAHRAGHDLKGIVQLTISLVATERGVDASVEVDPKHTTIVDPAFLECLRENARAIEDEVERLRDEGEAIERPLKIHVTREVPPTPEGAQLVQLSGFDDESSPPCPEGSVLTGTRGAHQWCVRPDGTKHGREWLWDDRGDVTVRTTGDDGTSSFEMRGPDRDL
jgi:RNA polymerase sigma factor (sigma-70 family)